MAGPSDADLVAAGKNRTDWLMYGRSYDNQRFSPLTQIKPANVKNLRPVWTAALNSLDGLEATPVVHGGVHLRDRLPLQRVRVRRGHRPPPVALGARENRKDSAPSCVAVR